MFLLDIRYNPENCTITKWIKDDTGCNPVRQAYYPRIYVSGESAFVPLIASLPGVKEASLDEKGTRPGCSPEKVISIKVEPDSVF